MIKHIEGKLEGKGKKFAIVASRFNDFITSKLLDGALDCLLRHNTEEENIKIYWVPGAFEMPLVAKRIAKKKEFDAIICLGAIIRGETPHFDFVASENAKGIASVSLQEDVPVIYGVLTTDTNEQAIDRAGVKSGNKGWSAALTALEMVNLLREI